MGLPVGFSHGLYSVSRLSKAGLWLVTAREGYDVAMLLLRAQEFYESPCDRFRGQSFALADYMRWYALTVSDSKAFTYASDYEGFNIPGGVVEACLGAPHPDPTLYDIALGCIVAGIRARQRGEFYLIGAAEGSVQNIDHEIAHGMYFFSPSYRAAATRLVEALGPAQDKLFEVLRKEGYAEHLFVDEAQAYMSTGLFHEIEHLDQYRRPFMNLFAKHRRRFIDNDLHPDKAGLPAVPEVLPQVDTEARANELAH
jgi:hypothetical protein